MEIWKQLLEKTEEAAKSHLTVSELLLSQVTEVARQQKRIKEQAFKRVRHYVISGIHLLCVTFCITSCPFVACGWYACTVV